MTSFWKHALASFAALIFGTSLAAQELTFADAPKEDKALQAIASFQDNRPTGVAVSSTGRVFVNFPYSGFSDERHGAAVVEIASDGTTTILLADSWNEKTRPAQIRFVNIQSLTIDGRDRLWLLDTGSPRRKGVVKSGAKLIEIDIATRNVVRSYPLSPEVVSGSDYVNDVRVDARTNFAYITDSVRGGVIVMDLATGKHRRVMNGTPFLDENGLITPVVEGINLGDKTGAPRAPATDGIALSHDGETVFVMYRPLAGSRSLLSIPAATLRDFDKDDDEILAAVRLEASAVIADGIAMGPQGRVHFTDLERNAISRLEPDGTITIVARGPDLSWPDAIAFGPDGSIYTTEAQFHRLDVFNDGSDVSRPPYDVFRIEKTLSQTGSLQLAPTLGHRTAFTDQGEGDAIILIHGLGADMSRFEQNLEALSEDHRVIALDLLGFGASDKPAMDYHVDVFVDQVVAHMDRRGVERATLVGNSMGGWVSLAFAEQFPERVDGLVLIAPAFFKGLPAKVSAVDLAAGALPTNLDGMRRYLGRVLFEPPTDEGEIRELLDAHATLNREYVIGSLARSIKDEKGIFTDERLSAIDLPTLVLQGAQDGIVPLESSKNLVDLLPNARLQVIESAGHWPQTEHADMVSEAIRSVADNADR
ncbi:alpha/beta fold hydrolase [Hoeflea poritis]|uniref:Alpha/beta fold hydrolase n=1 Tax=Hoeflea poritis TaxID=2993659 RepID=A0ABT4VT21_9HYPH|nr:alpha/beta fold hydrolase [Hoeflea poritis]MDA4847864.1 alpha/beta fold hydrolase [Hoeflea poritis]